MGRKGKRNIGGRGGIGSDGIDAGGAPGVLAEPQWEKHRYHWKDSLSAPEGNQYSDWALLYADASDSLIAGFSVDVYIEETATIPTAAYALAGITIIIPELTTELTIADGVTFSSLPRLRGGTVKFAGTAPLFTAGAFSPLFTSGGVTLEATSTSEMFAIPEGATMFAVNSDGKLSISDGAYEVFAATGTSGLNILSQGPLEVKSNSLRGVATTTVSVSVDHPSSGISESQANLPGGMTVTVAAAAARLPIDDTAFSFTAADVQAFADAFFDGNLEWLRFDNASGTPSSPLEGDAWWDPTDGTLTLQTKEADVRLQVGREFHIEVMNKTGAQINNGQLVYINGADVPSDLPTAALAVADGTIEPDVTIGFATHDIADDAAGIVTESGLVRSLDTSGCTAGDKAWLDPTTDGDWTTTKPKYPNQVVLVGYVLKVHATDGIIFTRVQFVKNQLQQLPIMVSDPSAFTEWVEGHYVEVVAAQAISDVSPYTSTTEFANAEAIINVTAFSGALTLRIAGDSVDEATGVISAADTEDHNITATGWYRSAKKWIGLPQFQILEGASSVTATINKCRYFDNSNNNFRIPAYKWQFTPSAGAWSFEYWLYRVESDGQLTELENDVFDNTDSPVWAVQNEPGTFKKGGSTPADALTYDFVGSGQEGLIVKIDNSAIRHLSGRVSYINT